MMKYSVKQGTQKTSSKGADPDKCPSCGGTQIEQLPNGVLSCAKCGTEPWEEAANE